MAKTKWYVFQSDHFPFRVEIRETGTDRVIAQFDRVAHSSKMKTLDDLYHAVGFEREGEIERHRIVAALHEQIANIHLMASAGGE